MILLRLVPNETHIPFLSARKVGYVFSSILLVLSAVLFFTNGLNRGIDFEGGILLEVGTEQSADINLFRTTLSRLGLGDVAVQEFGSENDVLIRIERQPGDAEAQQTAVEAVQDALGGVMNNLEYRRIEFVGPKVSGELVQDGITAVSLAVIAVLIYIWFRFEWQFGLGAVIALVHDVLLTIGFFSLTGLEFNLSIIAAILTIVGYSLNDTVVVYDRIRENIRKYRKMPMLDLLNKSLNDTLSRTLMTSVTTLLALLSLYIFGGAVIQGFTAAMIWGVFVGTYSSVFIAAPALLMLNVRRQAFVEEDAVAPTP